MIERLLFFFLLYSTIDAHTYKDELDLYIEKGSLPLTFDEEVNPGLRSIEQDVHNSVIFPRGLVRSAFFPFFIQDVVIVTEQSLPKLYEYIKVLCQKHTLSMPVVFITKDKKIFNAAAAKLFGIGGVVIGQGIINNSSDEELEAIIAHEIGHIKHNHGNKRILLSLGLYCGLIYTLRSLYKNASTIDVTIISHILAGMTADIIINKHFEREADSFVCKSAHRANGLITFFKGLQAKERKADTDFVYIRSLLDARRKDLYFYDYAQLSLSYYCTKFFHTLLKGFRWVYHNTPLGAHPGHQERIDAAQAYLASQEE